MTLRKILRVTGEKYNSAYCDGGISEKVYNVSKFFATRKPNYFPQNPSVLAYVVYNAPATKKYELRDGTICTMEFDNFLKGQGCLCVKRTQNTSSSELWSYMRDRENLSSFAGYGRKQLGEIAKQTNAKLDIDTIHMFARESEEEAQSALELNRCWLNNIALYGSRFLDVQTDEEKRLLGAVYSDVIETQPTSEWFQQESYMYNRPLHVRESVEFLENRFRLLGELNS